MNFRIGTLPMSKSFAPKPYKSVLEIKNISKTYKNGTMALQDVNLILKPSEFVSLLGPSGCGKSTLLRLIAGLGNVSSGNIEWPQAQYTASGLPIRDLGFVFQEPTLKPWSTVFENIYMPLKLKKIPRKEAKDQIMNILARVGLEKFALAYPRELSGGMKMRVSIARGLITQPSILLMDEPFAALDEITRFRLNDDLLAMWAGHNWTVVFVTHSVYESVYLSDRIIIMGARPGRIMADIPIDEPYPRSEAFRLSARYTEYCRLVSKKLHEAMT